ncbi:dTDP-4-dehydrorhamnose reductase [Allopusillimonas soli]|uniref:dTDP-4-dehydrorhamnose reductase n=1 Tax=Allopusillimonas soli TaxID=659016 RepID=A0A853FC34_9BURK|nr:dTDP-4-dehydrorhamnose reductase [Allopusillimonas soli]NYT36440.1 dTDP-4-dehydrorhamnose reductase [Allopusillimonas soli]TEA74949.1 dTDP-4-dehydrorhamnose reductase [Allopusillimonas soli]
MNILLLGKDGQVGWELQRSLATLGNVTACGRREADMEDFAGLRRLVNQTRADVIVNAAAYTAVDKAESDADTARRVNTDAVGVLAEEAGKRSAWLIHYSTDYVFDGRKNGAYSEDDACNPLSVYGSTKLAGEALIQAAHNRFMIFRTSWVYGSRGSNFAKTMLRLAQERDQLRVVSDQHGVPVSAEMIADVTALALHQAVRGQGGDSVSGIYHLASEGETNWHGYARYVLELAQAKGMRLKVQPDAIEPISTADYPVPAFRPQNSLLNTAKLQEAFGLQLPDWKFHVQRLIDELYPESHG